MPASGNSQMSQGLDRKVLVARSSSQRNSATSNPVTTATGMINQVHCKVAVIFFEDNLIAPGIRIRQIYSSCFKSLNAF
jgi:hypothetical protein